jgi:hypothetical protein
MTRKEAKELTLEMWRYLAEHPECYSKCQVEKRIFNKARKYANKCPLCEVFYAGYGCCKNCPLEIAGENCSEPHSVYFLWKNSDVLDKRCRQEAAGRIAEIVSAWEPGED